MNRIFWRIWGAVPRFSRPAGFTLLEILLAIFIFAVVVSTIFGTFNAVVSRTEAIKNGMGGYEMARTCLNRITQDLTTAYIDQKPLYAPPDIDDGPDPYRFFGKETFSGNKSFSWLRFAATDHLSLNGGKETGIAEIVYYVKEQGYPESEFVLKRADTAYPYDEDYEFEEKESDPVLCEGIEEFSLVYIDAEGNELEAWDSDADVFKYASPRAVFVKLKIKNHESVYGFETKIILPVFREKFE
jgi:general secretion pathway protein J